MFQPMLMPALDATRQLLDAVRDGGKEEDDLNHFLEELSQKINTQTEIVKEELRKYGKRWLGERYGFYKKNTYRNYESVVVFFPW